MLPFLSRNAWAPELLGGPILVLILVVTVEWEGCWSLLQSPEYGLLS